MVFFLVLEKFVEGCVFLYFLIMLLSFINYCIFILLKMDLCYYLSSINISKMKNSGFM